MSNVPPQRALKNVALFTTPETDINQTHTILLTQVCLPPSQPRRYFDTEAMERLKASIQKEGILQPILVRPVGDKYEVVAGERRYQAALSLNLTEIPVIIKNLSEKEACLIALTENLQREDLNPVEETEGVLALLSLSLEQSEQEVISLLQRLDHLERGNIKGDSESAHNVMGKEVIDEIFESLGLTWQSFLKNRLPLRNLPNDILDVLRQGQIEYTKAIAIAKVKDEQARTDLLQATLKENLSIREIRERIKALTVAPLPSPKTQVQDLARRINSSKLWEKEPKKWKKIQGWLEKIEELLQPEPEEDDTGINKETLSVIFEDSEPQEE